MNPDPGYLDSPCKELLVDRQGRPAGALPGGASGPLCVRVPAGLVLLRRADAPDLNQKALFASLHLHAEETLPESPEAYYLDSWSGVSGTALLAALPRGPLAAARTGPGGRQPVDLRRVIVPELLAPEDGQSGWVLWATPGGPTACVWEGPLLYAWHTLPAGLPPAALCELVAAAAPAPPRWVALDPHLEPVEGLVPELQRRWPGIRQLAAPRDAGEAGGWRYRGPEFTAFLHEEALRPADSAQKWRLGLAAAGALCAGLFFLFAEVSYLERQVERETHRSSLLKVQANRSGQLARRIGTQLQDLDGLRAMTVQRAGVLVLLRDLTDARPAGIRLEAISIERGGGVTLEGLAPTEQDVTHYMNRLGESRTLEPPTLTFAQKAQRDGTGPAIRFRLELRAREPLLRLPENRDDEV